MYRAPQSTPELENVFSKRRVVLRMIKIISMCCYYMGRVHKQFSMGEILVFPRKHLLVSGGFVCGHLGGEGAPAIWWVKTGTLLITEQCTGCPTVQSSSTRC